MTFRALDNLGLKLISLVLGFSLWYIVAGGQGGEIVLPIPLEYRNVPEGMEVIEESVQQVDIRLRGSSEILRRLTPQEIQVSVDLSGARPGEQNFYLSPENIEVPFGVRVLRVTPATVQLQVDRTARRLVQVIPRVVGSPASGFELANIGLASAEIEVTGPASRLEGMDQVTTEPLSVEGLREPYSQTIQIMLDDPYVRPVEGRGVEVTLDVREETIRKRLDRVPLASYPSSVKTKLTPSSVQVEIEGPRSLVELVREEDMEARVSVESRQAGVHRLSPELKFHREELSAIEVLSFEPAEVQVRVLPAEQP
jgi:YbbR domain-containing protein